MDKKITFSMIKCLCECPRKFEFEYIELIKPKVEQIYFVAGKCFHKAIELHYTGKDKEYINNYISKTMIDHAKENSEHFSDEENYKKFESELQLLVGMVNHYLEFYEKIDSEQFSFYLPEREFNFHFFKGWNLCGKIDAIVTTKNNEQIMEHKRVDSISSNYLLALANDLQSLIYVLACNKLGIEINKVIYNISVKKLPHEPKTLKNGQLSKDKNQLTTVDLYKKAIVENGLNESDYNDFLVYLEENKKQFFHRETLMFSKWQIEEIEEIVKQKILQLSYMYSNNVFPANFLHCWKYGKCPFYDICSTNKESRQGIIDYMYTKKTKQNEEIGG